jgi:hypothetical protein
VKQEKASFKEKIADQKKRQRQEVWLVNQLIEILDSICIQGTAYAPGGITGESKVSMYSGVWISFFKTLA